MRQRATALHTRFCAIQVHLQAMDDAVINEARADDFRPYAVDYISRRAVSFQLATFPTTYNSCMWQSTMAMTLRASVARWRKSRVYKAVYERFSKYSMIPPHIYCSNLDLAREVASIPGCVVECGVWKGGMIAGIASMLGPHRPYILFDSFQGLPAAKAIDGPSAIEYQRNTNSPEYYDNCKAAQVDAEEAMAKAGVRGTLIKGWFAETLPTYVPPSGIALLRLDGDWYDSTKLALERLVPFVVERGLVIVDDYGTWDGCTRAVNEYVASSFPSVPIKQHQGNVSYFRIPRRD